MKNINTINNTLNNDETKYIKILCNEKADIILKTEFSKNLLFFYLTKTFL